jgi:hypothetical protein
MKRVNDCGCCNESDFDGQHNIVDCAILLECGDYILTECNSKILKENYGI